MSLCAALTTNKKELGRQCWRTPMPLWRTLNDEYHFTVDAFANSHNALMRPFWSKTRPALQQDWHSHRVWANPPYDDLMPIVEHACANAGELAVLLLPVRAETEWWHVYFPLAERHWFRKRIAFDPAPGIKRTSNAFASVLFIFGSEASAGEDAFRDAYSGRYLK